MTALSNAEMSAINCIGAMFANAGSTSLGTAALRTPRKQIEIVPTLDAAIGVAAIRDHYQKEICHGNARVAKLLQKILFRYLPKENGQARLRTYRYDNFWWEKDYEDWTLELDATLKQVRTDFDKLEAWGLVKSRPMKVYEGKNAGKTVMHCRVVIAEGAASLNGWPDYSQLRIILGCPNGHSIAMPKTASHSNAQMGVHKTKEEVQKEKGKEEEKSKTTSASEKPLTTGSTFEPDNKATKEKGKTTPVKKLSWVTCWEDPIGDQTPVTLNSKQRGELKFMGTSMWKCGIDPREVIDYTKASWSKFVMQTVNDKGLTTHPGLTDPWALNFFTKYWDVAVRLLYAKKQSDAAWKEQAVKYEKWAAEYEAEKAAKLAEEPAPLTKEEKAAQVAELLKQCQPNEPEEVPHVPSAETLAEEAAWKAEVTKTFVPIVALSDWQEPPEPGTTPIEIEAHASIASTASASLTTGPAVKKMLDYDLYHPIQMSNEERVQALRAWIQDRDAKEEAEKLAEIKKGKPITKKFISGTNPNPLFNSKH